MTPKGFACPACGAKLTVARTRNAARGVVTRRRECPTVGCGYKVTTSERPATNATRQ